MHPNDRALLKGQLVEWSPTRSLRNWYPVGMNADAAGLLGEATTVAWRHLGESRFTEPFFQDSVCSQPAHEALLTHTPISALGQWDDGARPSAFIFHVSRCGSTLITQMLASSPQCIAMSEPPVLDAFFRLHHAQPGRSGGVRTFQHLMGALGQRRRPEQRHLVVKFDSWHTPWIPFVREAFPDTPIVFVYRTPSEVLASHRRQRGSQMVPGLIDTSRLEPGAQGRAPADLDGYAACVLRATLQAALDAARAGPVQLVGYQDLPGAVLTTLVPTLALACGAEELDAMKERGRFHGKQGGLRFSGDAAAQEVHATPFCLAAMAEAEQCCRQLEAIRLAHASA